MLGKIGEALRALLLEPFFVTCGVVAFVTALSFRRGRKTQTRGMKAALLTLSFLTGILALLMAVLIFAAVFLTKDT